jgi:hypothetical protein
MNTIASGPDPTCRLLLDDADFDTVLEKSKGKNQSRRATTNLMIKASALSSNRVVDLLTTRTSALVIVSYNH